MNARLLIGCIAIAAMAGKVSGRPCVDWRPGTVAPRTSAGMVYDAARAHCVLFGGELADAVSLGDTWTWDGTAWTPAATSGPAPRSEHAMVYDAARQTTLLFGGEVAGTLSGETWTWDGATWTQHLTTGPSARRAHSMAWDPLRHRVVLFGGISSNSPSFTYSNETWEWDGSTWTQVATPAEPARANFAMAWDANLNEIVLHGGEDASGAPRADTRSWNGSTWTIRSTSGPPRRGHSMAFDASLNRVVLQGGFEWPLHPGPEQTWEWDGSTWTLAGGTEPRINASMAYDSARARLVLTGGGLELGPEPTIVMERSGQWWTTQTFAPPPLIGPALAYDSTRGVALLSQGFRGAIGNVRFYETGEWLWNGVRWVNPGVSGPSPARQWHAISYDALRDCMVVFGGLVWGSGPVPELLSDTWEKIGSAWSLRTPTGPSAYFGDRMAFDRNTGRAVLLHRDGAETWEWNGVMWTLVSTAQVPFTGPVVFDPVLAMVVGGSGSTIYGWNGSAWTPVAMPGGAASPTLWTYDSGRDRYIGFQSGNTYACDRSTWTQLVNTGIPGVWQAVYDAQRGQVVIHTQNSETWVLDDQTAYFTTHPASKVTHESLTMTLTASASGPGTTAYRWRRNGADLVDDARISGASTPTLTITGVSMSDSGAYDVVATNACGSSRSQPATIAVWCAGDANGDAAINVADLSVMLAQFGKSIEPGAATDFNGDGVVDGADLSVLLGRFGSAC